MNWHDTHRKASHRELTAIVWRAPAGVAWKARSKVSKTDIVSQLMADRDDANRRAELAEELVMKTKQKQAYEFRRAERFKNELMTLRASSTTEGGDDAAKRQVSAIISSSMWSKEAITVRNFLTSRYEDGDCAELCARALAGVKDDDGAAALLSMEDTRAFKEAKRKIVDARDAEIYEHLSETVLAPRKSELSRLLLRVSWRKAGWLNSLFKWDWSNVDDDGVRYKTRQMLAPDSKQPMPNIFNLKEMRKWEATKLSGAAGNTQQADLRGAEAKSVDWCILAALEAARGSSMGHMATAGTEADPHWIMVTGDGAGLTEDDTGVRVGIFCGSVEKLNQSTHAVWNLVFYKASEHAESYETLSARCANVRPALCRIYSTGEVQKEDGTPSGVFVRFMLSADKPFLMKALGRKNMNLTISRTPVHALTKTSTHWTLTRSRTTTASRSKSDVRGPWSRCTRRWT